MAEVSERYRPSGRRVTVMAVFAAVALVAFVLLWDVRFNHPQVGGDPVFPWTDDFQRLSWTVLLLGLEALCGVAILLLLLIHPRAREEGEWMAEDWTSAPAGAQPADSMLQIGCPGCGTVFEKPTTDVDEPHEQDFRCPNCGRAGHLRMGLHRAVDLRDLTCVSCGSAFQAYRTSAECPHCHTAQTAA